MHPPLRVALVAGESSGDLLGANLIRSLKKYRPDLVVEGIGGPQMIAEGCRSLFAMDRLSVMGIVEPLKRLPELLHIRRAIKRHFAANPPDVFIGIDAPDFVLHIEHYLRRRGVRTVHYVSPSVWAWRQGRIHHIKQCVDLMLTLFPFEQAIYEQHNIPVRFVGHPLADEFPLVCDTQACRRELGLPEQETLVALLPGSRENEVALLAPLLLAAARRCAQARPGCHFLVPAANAARRDQLQRVFGPAIKAGFRCTIYDGNSHAVMGASDLVVLASGTATLEAMLLKKPMVVVYRLGALSYRIVSRLLKTPYVALPNLLAQAPLVPELIQDAATPERIADAMLDGLCDAAKQESLRRRFTDMHLALRCEAGDRAARAVLGLLGETVCA